MVFWGDTSKTLDCRQKSDVFLQGWIFIKKKWRSRCRPVNFGNKSGRFSKDVEQKLKVIKGGWKRGEKTWRSCCRPVHIWHENVHWSAAKLSGPFWGENKLRSRCRPVTFRKADGHFAADVEQKLKIIRGGWISCHPWPEMPSCNTHPHTCTPSPHPPNTHSPIHLPIDNKTRSLLQTKSKYIHKLPKDRKTAGTSYI